MTLDRYKNFEMIVIGVLGGVLLLSALMMAQFFKPALTGSTYLQPAAQRDDFAALQYFLNRHSAFGNDIKAQLAPCYFLKTNQNLLTINEFSARLNGCLQTSADSILHVEQTPTLWSSIDLPWTASQGGIFISRKNLYHLQGVQYNEPDIWYQLTHIDGIPIKEWLLAAGHMDGARISFNTLYRLTQLNNIRILMGLKLNPMTTLKVKNSKDIERFTLDVRTLRNSGHSAEPTLEGVDSLSYLAIKDLNTIPDALVDNLISESDFILDLRGASGFNPTLTNMLQRQFGNKKVSPLLTTRYKGPSHWHAHKREIHGFKRHSTNHNIRNNSNAYIGALKRELGDFGLSNSKKMYVMVDRLCRQECEIIAAASHHWENAILVGEKTAGLIAPKGSFTLPNSGLTLVYSMTKSYSRNAELISGHGITPEVNQQAFQKWLAIHPALQTQLASRH